MTNLELREALERQIAHRLGGSVKSKRASLWHRLIGRVCPVYLARHLSVFGRTVYVPSTEAYDADPWASFKALAKCYVLMEEQQRDKLFWVKWCFPQGMAIFALLAVFSPWWLLTLCFLAPGYAPWRREYLLRAYGMSVAIDVWTHGRHVPPSTLAARTRRVNSAYYLWPSHNTLDMVQKLNRFNDAAVTGRVCRDSDAFRDVLYLIAHARKYAPHTLSHRYITYQRDCIVHEAQ